MAQNSTHHLNHKDVHMKLLQKVNTGQYIFTFNLDVHFNQT